MALTSRPARLLSSVLLIASLFATMSPAAYSEEEAEGSSMRDVLESRERTEQLIRDYEEEEPRFKNKVSTPMSSILKLIDAFDSKDFTEAAKYLDTRLMPRGRDDFNEEQLLRAFAYVFGQQNILDVSSLSDQPEGNSQDGLPGYRDQIGVVTTSQGETPIYMQRVTGSDGKPVWKISNGTVQRIPQLWDELGFSNVALFLHERLPDIRFMGMQNWQVVGTLLFVFIAWPLASITTYLINLAAQKTPTIVPKGLERFFRGPLRFFIFILYARLLTDTLGLSLEARVLLDSSGVDYAAYTVLILGLITLCQDYQIRRMQAVDNQNMVALIRPITTIIKVLAVIIIALTWADSAGYNMSTILAGLGVGSLAVALAAQKTLENLIGGITIYAARPVSIGDFCRFGTVAGTVEEIGLRSTSIRTLDRTLLVIPNSVFASMELENYTARDYMRFSRSLSLLTTESEQLRLVLAGIRRMFHAHPGIKAGTNSVRLEFVEDATARIRLNAGIETRDYAEFLAVSEDINLRIIDIVFAAGAAFAGSSQITVIRGEQAADPEHTQQVHDMLDEWRAQGKLPFPEFSDVEIKRLQDSLDFPPRGSSTKPT